MPLEEGGIYQGDFVVDRIGNVADIPADELEAYRQQVRKRKLKSKMLDDWSAFHGIAPRLNVEVAKILGLIIGVGLLILYWRFVIPAINTLPGIVGAVMNIILLPFACIIVYGLHLYLPIYIIFFGMKQYEKKLPVLCEQPDSVVEITDPAIIESWRCCKWMKWQMVKRVIRSFFPETLTVLYQHIGKNKVAMKSAFFEAIVDTDYISIGENTLLSCDCHVYGYTLLDQPTPKLILKRTSIGSNTIVARSNVYAGAVLGDNVMIGAHSVVEKDSVLESGKLYAGAPAMEWKEFLQVRKGLKAKALNPV
jgi:serine acetyltransferase